MPMDSRSTDDLIRIATAGASFVMNAGGRPTDELIRIAVAAKGKGVHVTFRGAAARTNDDLIRIAGAGSGCVTFD
jgi:hypothetical protein